MQLRSPSDRFPAVPHVSIEVPDSWAAHDLPASVITAYDTASPAHFRVNATVAIERILAGPSLREIAARFAEAAIDDLPDYVVHGEEVVAPAAPDGLPRFLRLHSYRPVGAPFAVFQAQCLVLVPAPAPAGAAADLVSLHATCPGDVADRYGAVFRAVADSLSIGPRV